LRLLEVVCHRAVRLVVRGVHVLADREGIHPAVENVGRRRVPVGYLDAAMVPVDVDDGRVRMLRDVVGERADELPLPAAYGPRAAATERAAKCPIASLEHAAIDP